MVQKSWASTKMHKHQVTKSKKQKQLFKIFKYSPVESVDYKPLPKECVFFGGAERSLKQLSLDCQVTYQTATTSISRHRLIYKICLTSHQRHAKDLGAFDG